jgi:hypothetical protein
MSGKSIFMKSFRESVIFRLLLLVPYPLRFSRVQPSKKSFGEKFYFFVPLELVPFELAVFLRKLGRIASPFDFYLRKLLKSENSDTFIISHLLHFEDAFSFETAFCSIFLFGPLLC